MKDWREFHMPDAQRSRVKGEMEGGGQWQRDVYSRSFQRKRHARDLLETNACERKRGEWGWAEEKVELLQPAIHY